MSGVNKGLAFLEEFRKLDPEMPIHHASAFLLIAQSEGLTQKEVAQLIEATKSTAQRMFDKLSDVGVNGRPGLGLIEVRAGFRDGRERLAYLTPKGRLVVAALNRLTGG